MLTRAGYFSMKTITTMTVAIVLSCGTAMAHDSGDNHQDNTNATGPNPFMTFSGGGYNGSGYRAFAEQPAHHHPVHHHVKR